MRRVLVEVAEGQIGSERVPALRERYGTENVLATDIRRRTALGSGPGDSREGPYELLDVTDGEAVDELVVRYEIDTIYHLAAILSATGEHDPQSAYRVNMDGLMAVLRSEEHTSELQSRGH